MHEPSFTWSGHLPPKIYKNPIYSNKVFLGGVPWDITEGIFKNYNSASSVFVKLFWNSGKKINFETLFDDKHWVF